MKPEPAATSDILSIQPLRNAVSGREAVFLGKMADVLSCAPALATRSYTALAAEATRAARVMICVPAGSDGDTIVDGFDRALPVELGPAVTEAVRDLSDGEAALVRHPEAQLGPECRGREALIARAGGDGLLIAVRDEGAFNGEDARLLSTLARFAPAVLGRSRELPAADEDPPAAPSEEPPLSQFGAASPDIFWIRDARTMRAEYVSPAFETIYGVPVAAIVGSSDTSLWSRHILPEDRDVALAAAGRALLGETTNIEYRIRRQDGAIRWLRATDFPLLDANGRIERIGGIVRDITESKLASEESRRLEVELQHRVRNALGVIRALVRRTVEASDTIDDLASHLDGRINAFARVQAALARNPTGGVDLEHLLVDELLAYGAHEGGQVTVAGPKITLTAKAAETLGLILHELATNAVEHGVLGQPKGRVRVTWSVRPERDIPRLVIDWQERGKAGAVERSTRRGFGTELLERTLPYELNGTAKVSYEKHGIRCVLEVPMTPLVIAKSA